MKSVETKFLILITAIYQIERGIAKCGDKAQVIINPNATTYYDLLPLTTSKHNSTYDIYMVSKGISYRKGSPTGYNIVTYDFCNDLHIMTESILDIYLSPTQSWSTITIYGNSDHIKFAEQLLN